MKMRRLSLLFILALTLTPAISLKAALHFEHIDTHGHTVTCICRGADSVAWVGTSNGLTTLAQLQCNFPFSYVRHKALNEQINEIDKDETGRLWLLTNSNRLLVYDARRNHVITDVPAYLKQLGMPYANERLVTIGPQGRLWTSDGKNLCCYDFTDKRKQLIAMPANIGAILTIQHNDTNIFVATAHHIYGIKTPQNHVERIGRTPIPLADDRVIMVRDKEHNMWMAAENRFFKLEKGSSQWTEPGNVHHVKGIITTNTGETYVATTNYGLFIFRPGSATPVNLRQAPPNTNGLMTSHIESLYYSSKLDAVVIGYNKGGLSVVNQNNLKYAIMSLANPANQFNPADAISFAPAQGGQSFWTGTEDDGIYRLENKGEMAMLENRHRGKTVTALFTDSEQHLWTGIYNEGLTSDDGRWFFKGKSPYSIVQPQRGGRIFTALLGLGIHAVDPATGATQLIKTDNPWITDLTSGNGRLYAITNKFIYDIDPATLAVRKIPTTVLGAGNFMLNGHRDLHADSRGWLWMVSSMNHAPIYAYETATGKTHTLNNMAKYIVVAISSDDKGNIWCTTDRGLVRISHDGKRFTTNRYFFNIRHNFHYNPRALCPLPDGDMVAGTNQGIIKFNPQLLDEEQEKALRQQQPIITTLRINGVIQAPLSSEDDAPSDSSVGDIIYTKTLDLDHEEKNIFIECRPRGFMSEIAEQYYFQLKGYNNQWLPASDNSISLSNLQPGNYDLMLRTAPPGDPSSEDIHLLHIRIRQPFWLTPWGIAMWLSLAAIIGTMLFYFFRNRHIYQRQIRHIERQKRQEAELNEMKTRFFTNVSHDLRTPLTLIIAPVDQLIKQFTEHPTKDNTLRLLDTVKRNANRLLSLTNQILDMRENNINYEALQKTPTDIGKLLNELAATYMALAEKRNISFSVNVPEEQHILQTDKEKIYKIVSNLVSNSFKFTPDGGSITLDCSIQPTTESATMTLRVADTGMGISEKELPHIFERFYYSKQLHTSHESSGVGLNIVKQYTELMDGTISVERNVPQGTVFTIDIPVDEIAPEEWQQAAQQAEQKGGRPTILIADDNSELLSFIANTLSEEYNVVTVTNGEEALRVLADEQQTVDVVVSDIMMPGIDGLELTRRIKEDVNLSHIPVILLTAKALEEDQLKGLQMGANDYITKPFNADILRLRIRAWMQRRQVARERFSEVPVVEPEKLAITTLDEQLLQRTVSVVSEHMHDPDFNVDQLASLIGIHRTGLNRKLQFIVGQTPIVFIRTLRLKRARQLMEADPQLPVSQVAYQVGFNNPKIFSRYFAEEFGCKPSEYTKKLKEEN